jgi:hypothetical protein
MSSFINHIAQAIIQSETPRELLVVLPTQRAATFVKDELKNQLTDTTWLPKFTTLNQWFESITGLHTADGLEMNFYGYEAYSEIMGNRAQGISEFFSWCDVLFRDFNDIDAQLVEPDQFFKQLTDYTEIAHFSFLETPLSTMQQDYQLFWNVLPKIRKRLQEKLAAQNLSYPGNITRKAVEMAKEKGCEGLPNALVAGFNAFNKAEQSFLMLLQKEKKARIIYDTDPYYMNDSVMHAGLFIREQLERGLGEAFQNEPSMGTKPLELEICEAPHRQAQAQVVAGILSRLNPDELENTVLVLADEGLLNPVLAKLPANVTDVNISMGLGLKHALFYTWLEALFDVCIHKMGAQENAVFSIKHLGAFFSHPFSAMLALNDKNFSFEQPNYVGKNSLKEKIAENKSPWLAACQNFWLANQQERTENLKQLFEHIPDALKEAPGQNIEKLQAEKSCNNLLRSLAQLSNYKGQALETPALLKLLLRSLHSDQTDLLGEPTNQLQIMGLLETRALSFERVIFCSVNEGTLPQKTVPDSFIPFEIRLHHKLPGKREKEGVMAYYFYRLMQHANNVHLVYHSDKDKMSGGEKSRYIYQLEYDLARENNEASLKHSNLYTPESPNLPEGRTIKKTPEIRAAIKKHIENGLSTSSINRYLEDSLEWYYEYVLRLKKPDNSELDNAVFGSIVHKVLEDLHEKMAGKQLKEADLKTMASKTKSLLEKNFRMYGFNYFEVGINRLHFETAYRMIVGFLKAESELLKIGERVIYQNSEIKLRREMEIETSTGKIIAQFKGVADRVETRDGTLRVVDYKTGTVQDGKVKIKDEQVMLEVLKKKPKALQLLLYEWMMAGQYPKEEITSQIISMPAPRKRTLKIDPAESDQRSADFESFLATVVDQMLNPELLLEKNPDYEYAEFE